MKTKVNRFDLEDRLVDFTVLVLKIVSQLPKSRACNQLGQQLVRCGTSFSLNYAEAQSGESRKDFIHKMKISLKELRETLVCLKIIQKSLFDNSNELIKFAQRENNELIAIFVKSITTAQQNLIAE